MRPGAMPESSAPEGGSTVARAASRLRCSTTAASAAATGRRGWRGGSGAEARAGARAAATRRRSAGRVRQEGVGDPDTCGPVTQARRARRDTVPRQNSVAAGRSIRVERLILRPRIRAARSGQGSVNPKNSKPFRDLPVIAATTSLGVEQVLPRQRRVSSSTSTRWARPPYHRSRTDPGGGKRGSRVGGEAWVFWAMSGVARARIASLTASCSSNVEASTCSAQGARSCGCGLSLSWQGPGGGRPGSSSSWLTTRWS
jgi:hypothetical protein